MAKRRAQAQPLPIIMVSGFQPGGGRIHEINAAGRGRTPMTIYSADTAGMVDVLRAPVANVPQVGGRTLGGDGAAILPMGADPGHAFPQAQAAPASVPFQSEPVTAVGAIVEQPGDGAAVVPFTQGAPRGTVPVHSPLGGTSQSWGATPMAAFTAGGHVPVAQELPTPLPHMEAPAEALHPAQATHGRPAREAGLNFLGASR